MRSITYSTLETAFIGCSIALLAGCGEIREGGLPASAPAETAPSATADVHNHPSEGPHHGGLIELGNEEYHAELVHDEAAGTVTIYLLDSAAKAAVPINAKELQINLSHDGKAEQFNLAASPDSSDPAGKASRYVSSDAKLAELLDLEGVEAQLVVSIGEKQYRGAIEHDHEHEGHNH